MNTSHQDDNGKTKELVRIAVSGLPEEQWSRLQKKIFGLIESVTEKVADMTGMDRESTETAAEAVRDVAAIAAEWAKAKIEKPSLENEKLRADISVKFAEAKKHLAETQKIGEETVGLKIDNRMKQLTGMLDYLERLLDFMNKVRGGNISYAQVGQDGHLFIGPKPSRLKLPDESAPIASSESDE